MPANHKQRSRRVRVLHRPLAVRLVSAATAGYLKLIDRTSRWRAAFDAETVAMLGRGEGGIGVFWHQRLLGVPRVWRELCVEAGRAFDAAAIVSEHGDGELIARTLEKLGVGQIRGSTSRNGAQAVRDARALLDRGGCMAIVVDGPRGPHGHVHSGAVFLAKVTGRPLVPMTFAIHRGFQAKSWDRLLVPLPFAAGSMHVDTPIWVPTDTDAATLEAVRLRVQRRLYELNRKADLGFGVTRRGAEPLPATA